MPVSRSVSFASALAVLASSPAWSQTFADAPIACGSTIGYDSCTATFDGWTLSVTYRRGKEPASVAVYTKCVAGPDMITCMEGRWRLQNGSGALGARVVGLRGGVPFAD